MIPRVMVLVLLLPFKGKTPCNDTNIFWESHGKQHLRSKHTRIPNLYPLFKTFMITGEKQWIIVLSFSSNAKQTYQRSNECNDL